MLHSTFHLQPSHRSLRDTLSERQEHIATTRIPPATSNNTFSSRPSLPQGLLHRKKNTSRCLRPLFLVLRCTFSTRTSSSYSPSCFWQAQSTPIVLLLVSCDVHCTTSLSSLCLQYFPSCLAIFDDAYITLATALCRCSTAHRVPPPLQPARVLRASSLVTDIGPYKLLCRDCFSSVMKKNGDGHETRTAKV